MRAAVIITIATLALAGCDSYVSQYHTTIDAKLAAEKNAMQELRAERDVCSKGKEPRSMSRKEYLSFNRCTTKLAEKKVTPVAVYPDLFQKFLYTAQENAALYSQGKISYEQVEARGKIAQVEYQTEAQRRMDAETEKLALQDASERQAISDALNSYQPPPQPVYTSCSGFGRTMNCISY